LYLNGAEFDFTGCDAREFGLNFSLCWCSSLLEAFHSYLKTFKNHCFRGLGHNIAMNVVTTGNDSSQFTFVAILAELTTVNPKASAGAKFNLNTTGNPRNSLSA